MRYSPSSRAEPICVRLSTIDNISLNTVHDYLIGRSARFTRSEAIRFSIALAATAVRLLDKGVICEALKTVHGDAATLTCWGPGPGSDQPADGASDGERAP